MVTGNHKRQRNYQSVRLLIVLIMSLSLGFATDYFQFTETDQYELINLGEVYSIDGPLEEGNEIGVFDGDLCVGGVIYNGQPGQQLLAWTDDPTTSVSTIAASTTALRSLPSGTTWAMRRRKEEMASSVSAYSPIFVPAHFAHTPKCLTLGLEFWGVKSPTPGLESFRVAQASG